MRNGARAGAIAFIQKPFTRDSLLRAIEDALHAPPVADADAEAASRVRAPARP